MGERERGNVKTTLDQNVAEWPGKDNDGTKRVPNRGKSLEGVGGGRGVAGKDDFRLKWGRVAGESWEWHKTVQGGRRQLHGLLGRFGK